MPFLFCHCPFVYPDLYRMGRQQCHPNLDAFETVWVIGFHYNHSGGIHEFQLTKGRIHLHRYYSRLVGCCCKQPQPTCFLFVFSRINLANCQNQICTKPDTVNKSTGVLQVYDFGQKCLNGSSGFKLASIRGPVNCRQT